jgi:hypothetical protein
MRQQQIQRTPRKREQDARQDTDSREESDRTAELSARTASFLRKLG